MRMNRADFNAFRADLKSCVSGLEAKYGVTIGTTGSLCYSDESFTLKLAVANVGDNGESLAAAADWRRFAPADMQDKLGVQFAWQGHLYTISRWVPSSYKYSIIATRNGKGYKFSTTSVRTALRLETL